MAGIIGPIFAARQSSDSRDPEERRHPYSIRTLAGVNVTPDTAMAVPAVWGCCKYITESLACMPWHVMQRTGNGVEIASTHGVDWLLWAEPNKELSAFQFVETLVFWALLWGNGYAELDRNLAGQVVGMHTIPPWRVQVCRDKQTGELVYEIDSGTDGKTDISPRDMFHLRGFGHGPVGLSSVELLSQTIGWTKALALFGAAFFGNGMTFPGVFQQTGGLKDDQLARFKVEVESKHRGPWKAFKALFAPMGIEWKQVGIEPNKGQFIETAQFLIAEICRVYSVPPHIVAELSRSTNNNIEHQGIEAVQRCLLPWVRRLEGEANRKLFGQNNRRGYFTKMNMAALLRGDFKSQAEGFRIYREMGVVNADEVRDYLDMNKMKAGQGGDKYTMNNAYTSLERIGEEPVVAPAAPEAAPTEPPASDMNALAAVERISAILRVSEHV